MAKRIEGTGSLTALADWIKHHLMQAHRGAFVNNGRLVAFSNIGLTGPEEVHAFELSLVALRKAGYTVHGVGTCSDNFTWVAVAVSGNGKPEVEVVEEILWKAWEKALGTRAGGNFKVHKQLEKGHTAEAIAEMPRLPKELLKSLKAR
jgi:hypothetical protein